MSAWTLPIVMYGVVYILGHPWSTNIVVF